MARRTTHTLVGTRIRSERLARNVRQADLARAAGISPAYLNLIEHNRRGIGGRTLHAIARALGVPFERLAEGPEQALAARVREALAAARLPVADAAVIDEFIARFPEIARALARLAETVRARDDELAALTDRLGTDPFFAEAIHLMLTGITAIRTTAELLHEDPAMPEPMRARFLANLRDEAERLSRSAADLMAHFEPPDGATARPAPDQPRDETPGPQLVGLETALEQRGYHLGTLEPPPDPLPEPQAIGVTDPAAHDAARAFIARYAAAARALPLEGFAGDPPRLPPDPVAAAEATGVALWEVFFRLAHLPRAPGRPAFALIECDAAGGVLYRRRIAGFSLPRLGGACPLWPLYRALSVPSQPVEAMLELPTGERFLTWAVSRIAAPGRPGLPPRTVAAMLATPDYDLIHPKTRIDALPRIAGGVQCSLCARAGCDARRAAPIVG